MAIYSSINEREAREIETIVKPAFRRITLNDIRREKILLDDIKLYYRVERLEEKIRCRLIDDEITAKWNAEFEVVTQKGNDVKKYYDFEMIRNMTMLITFINNYGLRKFLYPLNFMEWIRSDKEDFNYYGFRF